MSTLRDLLNWRWPCVAEVGTPGNFRGCNKTALHYFRLKSGSRIEYCSRHAHRAGQAPHTGPLAAGETSYAERMAAKRAVAA